MRIGIVYNGDRSDVLAVRASGGAALPGLARRGMKAVNIINPAAVGTGNLYSVIGYTAMMAAVCIAALHIGRRAAWSRSMRITSFRFEAIGERIKAETGREAVLVFSRRLGEQRQLGTLLVIVHRLEVTRMTRLVRSVDPAALVDIVPSVGVSGEHIAEDREEPPKGAKEPKEPREPNSRLRVSKYGNTFSQR